MKVGSKVILGGGNLLPRWSGQIGEVIEIEGQMITVQISDTKLLVFPNEIQRVLNEPTKTE